MGLRGPKPGTPKAGGRSKGTPNKTTVRKALLLASVEEHFRSANYDPMAEMMKIAEKANPEAIDNVRFGYHQALAKKYYPDVAAVKVSGDPEAPLTFVIERTSYVDYIAEQVVSNGKGSTHTPTV